MGEVLAGNATPAQIAGFIVALRMKGETVEEIVGLLDAMHAAAESVPLADGPGWWTRAARAVIAVIRSTCPRSRRSSSPEPG